jgi:hypothetical protein
VDGTLGTVDWVPLEPVFATPSLALDLLLLLDALFLAPDETSFAAGPVAKALGLWFDGLEGFDEECRRCLLFRLWLAECVEAQCGCLVGEIGIFEALRAVRSSDPNMMAWY